MGCRRNLRGLELVVLRFEGRGVVRTDRRNGEAAMRVRRGVGRM